MSGEVYLNYAPFLLCYITIQPIWTMSHPLLLQFWIETWYPSSISSIQAHINGTCRSVDFFWSNAPFLYFSMLQQWPQLDSLASWTLLLSQSLCRCHVSYIHIFSCWDIHYLNMSNKLWFHPLFLLHDTAVIQVQHDFVRYCTRNVRGIDMVKSRDSKLRQFCMHLSVWWKCSNLPKINALVLFVLIHSIYI